MPVSAQSLILIVEDEPPQAELLRYNLEQAGFRTILATDGAEALRRAGEEAPDLMILDWMLPEMSGIEVCRRLRQDGDTRELPIIMLTARGEEADRVRGLQAGADDFVVKPFSPGELVARVQAVLRRRPGAMEETLAYAGVTMNLSTHKVTREARAVRLGPTEFRLLKILLQRPGRVFSRDELLNRAWGREIFVGPRTVDVHIRRLRQALNAGGAQDLIRTVRSAGYSLDAGPT